jgi:hypothetical protein
MVLWDRECGSSAVARCLFPVRTVGNNQVNQAEALYLA